MGGSTSVRRLLVLCGLAVLLGLLAGGAAFVLVKFIALLTNVALFGRIGWELPSFAELTASPRLVIAPMVGAAVVALLARWSPIIRGHGIPEAMESVLRNQSRIAPRTAFTKPVSAAVAIGTGGPFGAEGPIIVTGGSLGSLVGQMVDVSPSERKILLASGAAAGMAATFGAPLAAVVLAIELLLFEFSRRALVPLVVATSVAGGVHHAIFEAGPFFAVPAHDFAGLETLPLYAVLGLACGLLAVVISRGLFVTEALFRRLPVHEFFHPIIGAVGFGLVGLLVPRALGVGYDAIDGILAGDIAVVALATLLVAKLVAWWIALGSGTSGGTLAPVLLISGAFGALLGTGMAELGLAANAGAFALVAMSATFGAAARAPLTSIVFLFELTRDYNAILPLMLATVIAELLAAALLRDSLMTERLSRRGIRVQADYEADVLRSTPVGDVMTTHVATLPADASVRQALAQYGHGSHSAYPLMDHNGACVAIVARSDLLAALDEDETRPLYDIASADVITIRPDATCLTALQRILDENVEHLPVVRDSVLVGICTRTDLLRARGRQLREEQRQRGWLARRLRPVRVSSLSD